MHDAEAVHRIEPIGQLSQRRSQARLAQSSAVIADPFAALIARIGRPHVGDNGHAAHELHRKEPVAAVAQELVERDEIRMRNVGQRPELALEAIKRGSFAVAQELQRHPGGALAIERFVHDAKAAFTQRPNELEALRTGELMERHRTSTA